MARLSTRQQNRMSRSTFAFPNERKEPLNDARHVRNAIARFDQVEGVSDSQRQAAWRRIKAAAKKVGVEVHERSWRELMRGGKGRPPSGGGGHPGPHHRPQPERRLRVRS